MAEPVAVVGSVVGVGVGSCVLRSRRPDVGVVVVVVGVGVGVAVVVVGVGVAVVGVGVAVVVVGVGVGVAVVVDGVVVGEGVAVPDGDVPVGEGVAVPDGDVPVGDGVAVPDGDVPVGVGVSDAVEVPVGEALPVGVALSDAGAVGSGPGGSRSSSSPKSTLWVWSAATGMAQRRASAAGDEGPASKLTMAMSARSSNCRMGMRVQLSGLVCLPPSMVSKCRWQPVDHPVVPTRAMTWPTCTESPVRTAIASKWL
jgi:hypothetical protein